MNRKLSTILLLAFLVAAVASYVVYRVAGKQMHPVLAPVTTQILVPARNLPIGTLIRDADLTTGKWLGPPPKGALVTKEAAIGRGVLSDLYEGEPILRDPARGRRFGRRPGRNHKAGHEGLRRKSG